MWSSHEKGLCKGYGAARVRVLDERRHSYNKNPSPRAKKKIESD